MTVLGIDVGTTNTKVGVFDPTGHCLARATRRTPAGVDELAAGVLDAIRRCVEESGAPDAIGVAGMAETGAAIDRHERPLTPLIFWTEARGAEHAAELNRACGLDELYRVTGRVASAKSPLATWLWLCHNEPAVPSAMMHWLGAPDLVVHALTGLASTHPTVAARTLAFDLATGDYDDDLLAIAGLRPHQLPAPTGFDGLAGRISADAAAATGLRVGTPVVHAGHDHSVGAWAAGVRAPGSACLSLGTSEAVLMPTEGSHPVVGARERGFTGDYRVDGTGRCLVGGLPACGALIEWTMSAIGNEHDDVSSLLAQAALPTGILVLPYPYGRAAPAPDPEARLTVHGRTDRHSAADLLAATVEGTCLHSRWMTDVAAELARTRVDRTVLIGGLSRLPALTRIKAALAPELLRRARIPDTVCLGAALRAAAAVGLPLPEPDTDPIPTDPALRLAYRPVYRQWLRRALSR